MVVNDGCGPRQQFRAAPDKGSGVRSREHKSALRRKQTCGGVSAMSAVPPKADIREMFAWTAADQASGLPLVVSWLRTVIAISNDDVGHSAASADFNCFGVFG